ncbi:MAG: hypothetical protein D6675_04670 [Gemmatimonadetes bacterium]|nr:MAG: hypothetical protein D6675_04670 [Gemmatimonadota bacterium]
MSQTSEILSECWEHVHSIRECVNDLSEESSLAIAAQRLKIISKRLQMEMNTIAKNQQNSTYEEQFSLLGQVVHNLQLIVDNKKLETINKAFFISALANMMQEFMDPDSLSGKLFNMQKAGNYEMGYLKLETFRKWSTAAVSDLGKNGVMVMRDLTTNEWNVHAFGEISLGQTIGAYGFEPVEQEEFVEIFKSMICEGLAGNIVLNEPAGAMAAIDDAPAVIADQFEKIEKALREIENLMESFPELATSGVLKRLNRLRYRLEMELYSIAEIEAGAGGEFGGGVSLADQIIENTIFILDIGSATNEDKVSLIAALSGIMLEFTDSATFPDKLIGFNAVDDKKLQGYVKFDSLAEWFASRNVETSDYGVMMLYSIDHQDWDIHYLSKMQLQNAINSYNLDKLHRDEILGKFSNFLTDGLKMKQSTIKKRFQQLNLI